MRIFVSNSCTDPALVDAIRERLQRSGNDVTVRSAETITDNTVNSIYAQIAQAAVVVLIADSPSPNTFFELGLATGLGIPVALVSDRNEALVASFSGLPFVQITGDHDGDAQATAEVVLRIQHPSEPSTSTSDYGSPRGSTSRNFADSTSPREFENTIRDWFNAHGASTTAPSSRADLGYDFAIHVTGGVYLVQVKLTARQSLMSLSAVRSLTTVVVRQRAAGGILVSNARYTSAATNLAKESSIALVTTENLSRVRSVTELLSGATG